MTDLKIVGPRGKVIPPPGQNQNQNQGTGDPPIPLVPGAQVIAQIEKVGDQVGLKGLIPMDNEELALALLKLGTALLEKTMKNKSSLIIPR